MNAAITGCAGFIGSHLAERIVASGGFVVGFDSLLTGRLENIQALRGDPAFRFHRLDVAERGDAFVRLTVESLSPIDTVFHLASPASPSDYARCPLETVAANSRGTEHAIALAEIVGARLVLASTSEVYGEPLEHPQREEHWGHVNPVGPRSPYDESKRFAEMLVALHVRLGRLEATIARIFNTYGPRMRPDDGRVIPSFLERALAGRELIVEGDGTQTRSFLYVDDLVDGLIAAAGLSRGELIVNLGNPRETTILELAEIVCELLEVPQRLVHGDLPTDCPTRRRPDIARARRFLGWEPQVELREGLARTIEHLAQQRRNLVTRALHGPRAS